LDRDNGIVLGEVYEEDEEAHDEMSLVTGGDTVVLI
jgi:hypothetical protein